MSPQADVQVEFQEVKIPHGLSPFCLGLAATPTVLSAARPQLDTGLMGRGMEVTASFLICDSQKSLISRDS